MLFKIISFNFKNLKIFGDFVLLIKITGGILFSLGGNCFPNSCKCFYAHKLCYTNFFFFEQLGFTTRRKLNFLAYYFGTV